MKPMTLKEPSKCCKSPTLLWNSKKAFYVCPCGEMKANQYGQLRSKPFMNYNCRSRKPVKSATA